MEDVVEAPAPPRSHRTRRDRKRRADRDPSLVRRALDRERAVLMQKRRTWKRLLGEPHAAARAREDDAQRRDRDDRRDEDEGWVLVAEDRPPRRFLEGARAWLRRVLGGWRGGGGLVPNGEVVPNDVLRGRESL